MKFKRTLSRLTAGLLLAVSVVSPALAATGAVDAGDSALSPHAKPNTSSSATADGPQTDATYIKVTEGPLNIRTGPGTDYSRAGQLPVGRTAKVLDVLDGWYQIEAGYVCADYVEELEPAEAQTVGKGQEIADYALQFLGYDYVYGGSSPSTGFDCSGLTSYVYKQFGYSLYRTAADQLKNGVAVSRDELQPGDLVLFKKNTTRAASHVGLYIGNDQFIHAATSRVGVVISSLSENYYATGFVGARRIV